MSQNTVYCVYMIVEPVESTPHNSKETSFQDVFETTYETYFTPLYKYFWIRIRDNETSLDLTQTVFIKLYQANKTITQTNLLPYLYTVARTTLIDYWRKQKTISTDDWESFWEQVPDTHQPHPETVIINQQESERLRQSFSILSPLEQDIIILKFFQELDTQEVVTITGKNPDAIRKIQSRAIQKLRTYYEQ